MTDPEIQFELIRQPVKLFEATPDSDGKHCDECGVWLDDEEFLTAINPDGFYGRPRVLACDTCVKSDYFKQWRADHWPEWPELHVPGIVAFEGMVKLQKWSDSSSSGPKVGFLLADRDALIHFEKATKRRGKRAGQRYMLVVGTGKGDVLADAPSEAWFAGAQWSHQGGASITLVFETVDYWRRFSTEDSQGDGQPFHLTMVELNAQDEPIDQGQRDMVEKLHKPKGGPHSKFAAQRNQEAEFQAYVGHRSGMPRDRWRIIDAGTCDRWVKQMLGITSKIELDTAPETWERYEKMISRPFVQWRQATYG